MKLQLLTNFFPPEHIGGTENYTYSIARGLLDLGHNVQVLCAGRWGEGDDYWNGYRDEEYNRVQVRRLHLNWTKAPDPNRYLYNSPVVADYLSSYLREHTTDLVHITSCHSLSAAVISAIKDINIPVVVTLTDFWFLCPRLTLLRSDGKLCNAQTTATQCLACMLMEAPLYYRLSRVISQRLALQLFSWVSHYRFLTHNPGLRGFALDMRDRKAFLASTLARADYILAPSKLVADMFFGCVGPQPIHTLRSGIDLAWLASYPGKRHSPYLRIGYMGQIQQIKGIHLLIQAFTQLNSPNVRLIIAGPLEINTAYVKHLQDLAAGDERISFTGRFSREMVGHVLANFDVLVVPSIWYETYGLVIAEAFAAKVPVIASNLGAMAEFIEPNVNGLLFTPGDVQDLSHQLRRLVEDPSLLSRLAAGIPRVKTTEEEVVELESLYLRLLDRSQGHRSLSVTRTDSETKVARYG